MCKSFPKTILIFVLTGVTFQSIFCQSHTVQVPLMGLKTDWVDPDDNKVEIKIDSIPTLLLIDSFYVEIKHRYHRNKILWLDLVNESLYYEAYLEYFLFDTAGITLRKIETFSDKIDSNGVDIEYKIGPIFYENNALNQESYYITWCYCYDEENQFKCNVLSNRTIFFRIYPPYDSFDNAFGHIFIFEKQSKYSTIKITVPAPPYTSSP